MKDINKLWEKTLEYLEPEMTPVSYQTWVQPIHPVSFDEKDNILTLAINNEFGLGLLQGRYRNLLENASKIVFGIESIKISFVALETEEDIKKKDALGSGYTDEFYLNPKYIFDTFVIGMNNRFAHAASKAVAESPAKAYNPLFIYGAAGLGKTHLMHAIGHSVMNSHPHMKVLYVSTEMFTNELINAIQNGKTAEFRQKYRNNDVLMIDDIQFIEKKESTQEEIFHTFNTLYEANKQIIISSDRPPKEIVTLEERLRSRFEWGLIADIQAPDYETRVAILTKKAELEDVPINEGIREVIEVIAEKIKANIRELEGAFIRVVAYANLINQKIDKDLAKIVLKDVFDNKNKEITPVEIKKQVCKYFNIKISDMESSKRSRDLAFPRQIAMYICRNMTDLSLPKIGEYFGNRDHTTVLHACDKITNELKTNSDLKEIITSLEDIIRQD